MVVADDEVHAGKVALDEVCEEDLLGGFDLAREDAEAEDLAPPVGVDRSGQGHRDAADAPLLAGLDGEGVEPQVGVRAVVKGRARKAATSASRLFAISETWLFEMPSMPSVFTSPSTRRVKTPRT